jgi:uncharacterized protein (DUF58 family)
VQAAAPAPLPTQGLRPWLRQWLHSRLPRTDALTLSHRNVYILPTRAGLMLAITLLVLLVASINYQLNLGHLLTFLLAGSAVAGLYLCHANLRGLGVQLLPPAAVHAGEAVTLEVRLTQDRARTRHGLGLRVSGHLPAALTWTDVPAGGSTRVQLAWVAPHRGLHALPALEVQTLFPLGTCRAWTRWQPASPLLVYPTPETQPPPVPAGTPRSGNAGAAPTPGSQELDGLRPYRRGDPLRSVVWKKAARSFAAGRDDLVSREAVSTRHQQLWLDEATCGIQGLEARLSRLTAWVLLAERQGLDYGLRVNGREIPPDQGPAHRACCLEALALC